MAGVKSLELSFSSEAASLINRALWIGWPSTIRKDRLLGATIKRFEELPEHLGVDRPVVQHETELTADLPPIMFSEKRRPVTSTTGVSPMGAHVVPV